MAVLPDHVLEKGVQLLETSHELPGSITKDL
jgi:hypothetical protein